MGLQLRVVSCDHARVTTGQTTNEQSYILYTTYVDRSPPKSKRKTCTILSLSPPLPSPYPVPRSPLHRASTCNASASCSPPLLARTLFVRWCAAGLIHAAPHADLRYALSTRRMELLVHILATFLPQCIVCRICELRPKAHLTGSCASRGAPAGDHQDRRWPPKGCRKGWMAAVKAMAVLLKDPGRRPTNGWGGGEKATSPTAAGPGGERHHEHHERLGLCGQGHATGGKPRWKNRVVRSLVWPTTQPAFRAGQWRLRRAVP